MLSVPLLVAFSLIGNQRFLPHAVFAFVPGIPMLFDELPLHFFDPTIPCPVFLLLFIIAA